MPFIPWCMIIWKNYVFDKSLLAYTHLTFREEWVLLFFHQPVFPFQWLATGRVFSPFIKDKKDGSYHTRTDPLTLASSRISKSVQTYPLKTMYSRLFMGWLQYIWLNLWNHMFHHVLCVPSQHQFTRYLKPEQRPMVTAVSTRPHQLCGTTYHSSSKLWTCYQLLSRV